VKPARVFAVALPALAIGCGAGSNAPDSHASAGKRVRLAPTLVVTSLDASVDAVSSHDELAAAAAKGRRRLKADVDPVVAMRWHGKAFDEAALMELVAARARWIFSDADVQGVASTEAIGQRYGERFDDIWHAWMALYGAELEDRYGVVVESADVTSERSRGVHALALALVAIAALPKAQSPEETSLTWKGGVFELGAVQRSPPRPPLTEPGAANDRVVETIVASRLGDYYDYPLLSHAPVNIETNAEEGIAPDRFVASGESGIAEVVEGSTRTGKTLRRIIRGSEVSAISSSARGRTSSGSRTKSTSYARRSTAPPCPRRSLSRRR